MEFLIQKTREDEKNFIIKIMYKKDKKEDFDYIKMIEHLYHNPSVIVKFSFSDDITDEERKRIKGMFDNIREIVCPTEAETKEEVMEIAR